MDVKWELDLSEYQWCIKRGDGAAGCGGTTRSCARVWLSCLIPAWHQDPSHSGSFMCPLFDWKLLGAAHCLYMLYAPATTPRPRQSQVSQGVSLNFWVVHRLMKQNSGVSLKGLVKPKLVVLSFNNIQLQVDSMVVYNCLNGIVVGNSC
ncbi:hypothetical protein A2U01_0029344 [Trifolium medium]|uniref:Uncharacterized protein n=1 Tax=Trifolium medium TaxID=97028 RepID=A0A392P873_9FABA|nr:hypothetical protein [Trifolium medium]